MTVYQANGKATTSATILVDQCKNCKFRKFYGEIAKCEVTGLVLYDDGIVVGCGRRKEKEDD